MPQHEDVKALLVVNGLDREIAACAEEKAHLLRTLAELEACVTVGKQAVEQLGQQRKSVQKRLDNNELEMGTIIDKQGKLRVQQNQARTNEEYRAFASQIEAASRECSDFEDDTLRGYEELDELARANAEAVAEVKRCEARLIERQSFIDGECSKVEAERLELVSKREEALAVVQPQAKLTYDRLHGRYEGAALANVDNRTCQGCYIAIPTGLMSTVLAGTDVVSCPQCARVLYVEADVTAESVSYQASGSGGSSKMMPGD